MAANRRKIEIFSAGCLVCESAVEQITAAACASCDIQVLNMNAPDVRKRATELGIRSVPAVVIDGKLADCCSNRGIDLAILRAAGLGQALA